MTPRRNPHTSTTATVLASIAAALVLAAVSGGCNTCEADLDCLITCDCNDDDVDDAIFPHACTNGVCTEHYDSDARKGCEQLCDEATVF